MGKQMGIAAKMAICQLNTNMGGIGGRYRSIGVHRPCVQ